jgi:pSer/pThr/pTyr-binding forkhead associated (FHA) protein
MTADLPWKETADQLIIGQHGQMPGSHAMSKDILVVGRGDDSDIVLPDRTISRRHIQLQRTADGWQVTDLESSNRTYMAGSRLLAGVAEPWRTGQTLKIGAYFLQWRRGGQRALTGVEQLEETTAVTEIHQSAPVSVTVTPEEVAVEPDETANIEIALFNQEDIVSHYFVVVQGLPREWVTLPQEPLRLFPGESGTMQVQIQPPRATNAAAGRHQYQIAIGSEQAAAVIMTIPGVLTIAPYEQFVADMQPRTLKNRSTTQILITNEGNITSTFHVIGRDPGEALHFIDPRKQQEEKKKVRQTVNAPNTPRWLRPILRLRLMQMLPFMRDARQAQAFIRRFSQLGKSIGLAPKE